MIFGLNFQFPLYLLDWRLRLSEHTVYELPWFVYAQKQAIIIWFPHVDIEDQWAALSTKSAISRTALLYLKSSKSSFVNLWSHVFNIFSVLCGRVSMPLILRQAEINSLMFFTMVMASGPKEGTSSVLTLCLVTNFRNRFCPAINKRGRNTPWPSCFQLPIQPLWLNHLFLIFRQYLYIFPFRMYFFQYFPHVCGML